jgi:hypothetical protein
MYYHLRQNMSHSSAHNEFSIQFSLKPFIVENHVIMSTVGHFCHIMRTDPHLSTVDKRLVVLCLIDKRGYLGKIGHQDRTSASFLMLDFVVT